MTASTLSAQLITFTLEHLVLGGETWWLSGVFERGGDHGDAALDAAAACCPNVLFEPEPGSAIFRGTAPD